MMARKVARVVMLSSLIALTHHKTPPMLKSSGNNGAQTQMRRINPERDDDAERRISVPLTGAHRRKIIAAMEREGIKSMSDFLRFAALERARAKE